MGFRGFVHAFERASRELLKLTHDRGVDASHPLVRVLADVYRSFAVSLSPLHRGKGGMDVREFACEVRLVTDPHLYPDEYLRRAVETFARTGYDRYGHVTVEDCVAILSIGVATIDAVALVDSAVRTAWDSIPIVSRAKGYASADDFVVLAASSPLAELLQVGGPASPTRFTCPLEGMFDSRVERRLFIVRRRNAMAKMAKAFVDRWRRIRVVTAFERWEQLRGERKRLRGLVKDAVWRWSHANVRRFFTMWRTTTTVSSICSRLQALFRRHRLKRAVKRRVRIRNAARVIQKLSRAVIARYAFRRLLNKRRDAARLIQSAVRARAARARFKAMFLEYAREVRRAKQEARAAERARRELSAALDLQRAWRGRASRKLYRLVKEKADREAEATRAMEAWLRERELAERVYRHRAEEDLKAHYDNQRAAAERKEIDEKVRVEMRRRRMARSIEAARQAVADAEAAKRQEAEEQIAGLRKEWAEKLEKRLEKREKNARFFLSYKPEDKLERQRYRDTHADIKRRAKELRRAFKGEERLSAAQAREKARDEYYAKCRKEEEEVHEAELDAEIAKVYGALERDIAASRAQRAKEDDATAVRAVKMVQHLRRAWVARRRAKRARPSGLCEAVRRDERYLLLRQCQDGYVYVGKTAPSGIGGRSGRRRVGKVRE